MGMACDLAKWVNDEKGARKISEVSGSESDVRMLS
jgi:hypothetical protein